MTNDLKIGDLRCEYKEDPLGIDVAQPRLSWKLSSLRRGVRQTAYQVRVAASEEALRSGEGAGILWDSGRVESDQSVHVPYGGRPLGSGEPAYWAVTVWDENGHPAEAESPAFWEMGLLERSEWTGKWIGGSLVGGARTTIPCPQRDERLGWTGDAQVFVRTAAFNRNVTAFFTKWQQDLADAQAPSGTLPPTAPTTGVIDSDGGPAAN